eukprot:1818946-Amphidinium_carterae.1
MALEPKSYCKFPLLLRPESHDNNCCPELRRTGLTAGQPEQQAIRLDQQSLTKSLVPIGT